MTDYSGDLVGGVINTAQSTPLIPLARNGGVDKVWRRDTIEVVSAFAQNDRVSLGSYYSDLVIDPITSFIWFDDMGTSITMDVGSTASEDALVAAQDVATAAGSCSLYKSVDVAKYPLPLWSVLGLSADPGGTIELFAKLEGGNPGTGTISWQVKGQRLG